MAAAASDQDAQAQTWARPQLRGSANPGCSTSYEEALDRVREAAGAAKAAATRSCTGAASDNDEGTRAQAELRAAKANLKRIKGQLAKSRKRKKVSTEEEPREHPAWRFYPQPRDLPRDSTDPRWVRNFAVEPGGERQEAWRFWDEWGFVVFRDILTPCACRATVAEIWDALEERTPGLSRDAADTYQLLPAARYGLPDEQAVFTSQVVQNRQSPRLYAAIDTVTPRLPRTVGAGADGGDGAGAGGGAAAADDDDDDDDDEGGDEDGCGSPPAQPGPNSIVVSQDRWCLYPPSLGQSDRQTNNPGAHLDLCPWAYLPRAGRRQDPEADIEALRYEGPDRVRQLCDFRAEINCVLGEFGPHNQGVLNLVDNEDNDGGTALVPGFHRCFAAWSAALGSWEANRMYQRRRGNAFVFGDPRDPIHALMRRVTLRAGSLLLWNQCTVHGAEPNASDRVRVAQFVRGFRAGEMGPARKEARAKAVRRELETAGLMHELGPLAPHVFGINTHGNVANSSPNGTTTRYDTSEQTVEGEPV
eukprot:COSAG05_NODE_2590_length_2865_cov_2.359364_1_plen_532_part_00